MSEVVDEQVKPSSEQPALGTKHTAIPVAIPDAAIVPAPVATDYVEDAVAAHVEDAVAAHVEDPVAAHVQDPVAPHVQDPVAPPVEDHAPVLDHVAASVPTPVGAPVDAPAAAAEVTPPVDASGAAVPEVTSPVAAAPEVTSPVAAPEVTSLVASPVSPSAVSAQTAPVATAPAQAAASAPANVVWTLVPTVVFGDGTSAPASFPAGFNPSSFQFQPPSGAVRTDGSGPSQAGHHQQHMMVQIQAPPGQQGQGFPHQAYIVAPPNFAASLGVSSGQNITFALPSPHPTGPQARVSNDPNQPLFTLDLSEDNTDLPLPLEDEVDLSTYPYKINLGKDVVSGKGGKVQQLNRHFRNMVAAAYPTYDSTSSKISKRKIGLKIYQAIIDRGGRFLDIDGKPMDRPKSILKVMKALKDAKTWTSDAKRLAKRKREEQRTKCDKEAKRLRDENTAMDQHIHIPREFTVLPLDIGADVHQQIPTVNGEEMDSKQAHGPGSPCSSLLEKRGQALPTQKQKKAQPPSFSVPQPGILKTEDGAVALYENMKLEQSGESVGNPIQPRYEMHYCVQPKQEMHYSEQTSEDVDAAIAEISADAALEEAAAAAAAAVAAGEAAEEAQAAAGTGLGGLQLLTKAAADAGDPDAGDQNEGTEI